MAVAKSSCVKNVFLLIFTTIFAKCFAEDILGCGGFVKSHVPLDFSQIVIELYTKAGILKEHTECAPTNGYYFLPLYEKGEYVLKVHPPSGWSFEPSQVELTVDGVSDKCSTGQDINFAFNGFGITGKVTSAEILGASNIDGPAGITVKLINDKGEIRETKTEPRGNFHFTPVIPGHYILKASHPTLTLDPATVEVNVEQGNTVLPVGSLMVKGYQVKGTVISYTRAPIPGVYVLLFGAKGHPSITDCLKEALKIEGPSGICHSISDANGEFSFGLLPVGDYELFALTKPPGADVDLFSLDAQRLAFKIENESLYIAKAFQVGGWTVVGQVLTSKGGVGLPDVQVMKQDEKPRPKVTDSNGKFVLPSLIHGTYTISFQHEKCRINDVQITVTPTGGPGPLSVTVARWLVSGSVTPTSQHDKRYVVVTTPQYTSVTTVVVSSKGKWEVFLPPGEYVISVKVEGKERSLVFYPQESKITVKNGPVEGLVFSQLKAKVSGRVECIDVKACEGLPITLRPLSSDGGYLSGELTTTAKAGQFEFKDVLPGSVQVFVPTNRLCWAEPKQTLIVSARTASLPAFAHTGYVVPLRATHQLTLEYKSDAIKGNLSIPAGDSIQCLPRAARFTLTPRGPHLFEPETLVVSTTDPVVQPVEIVAVRHAVRIKVYTGSVEVKDLMVKVTLNAGSTEIGPLERALDNPEPSYMYPLTVFLKEGEMGTFKVWSNSALVSPTGPQQVMGTDTAQLSALTFQATPALILRGRIQPPVQDVLLTLTSDELILMVKSSHDGTYSFGPLDASKKYTITAEKESYVFSERDKTTGVIIAHKLAEINVLLEDQATGEPLQGALVSVSGGSYRHNAASGAGGRLRFAGLSPAHYYVKPNMKEYRFTPPHHIVQVEGGQDHPLTLRGVRVAWSAAGILSSVAGAGWGACALRARPLSAHAHAHAHCRTEEATTDADGGFRIRGLLPGCEYGLELKECSSLDLKGLKLVSYPDKIEIKDKKDIENINLIAILPEQITDANVLVYTANVDHYKYLRLTLAPENNPHSPIYSTKVDATGFDQYHNPGLMFPLPRLPADNKTYVVQLESTLSKATHVYEEMVQYLRSDGSFKFFNFDFFPKVKTSEQDLKQTSVLVVPLLGIMLVLWYHRAGALQHAAAWYQRTARAPPARQHQHQHQVLDKASIDHILSTINPPKKSKKKAQ